MNHLGEGSLYNLLFFSWTKL